MVDIIFACGRNGEFGKGSGLPWVCKSDMERFKAITLCYKHIIVGRSTYNNMGPLKDRTLIVVTKTPEIYNKKNKQPNVHFMRLEEALELPEAIVIGGVSLIKAALPEANKVMISNIFHSAGADTYLRFNGVESFHLLQMPIVYQEQREDHTFIVRKHN